MPMVLKCNLFQYQKSRKSGSFTSCICGFPVSFAKTTSEISLAEKKIYLPLFDIVQKIQSFSIRMCQLKTLIARPSGQVNRTIFILGASKCNTRFFSCSSLMVSIVANCASVMFLSFPIKMLIWKYGETKIMKKCRLEKSQEFFKI